MEGVFGELSTGQEKMEITLVKWRQELKSYEFHFHEMISEAELHIITNSQQ